MSKGMLSMEAPRLILSYLRLGASTDPAVTSIYPFMAETCLQIESATFYPWLTLYARSSLFPIMLDDDSTESA